MRELFSSRLAALITMIGVAVGLGNVWRFPYMVGKFGGAPFVLVYGLCVVLLGIPALMAEWSIGRHTRRGPVGAFEAVGLPGGRWIGWLLFVVVLAASGYYSNALGWVLYHALGELASLCGIQLDASAILPPEQGFDERSFVLQLLATGTVLLACATVVLRGLRAGIERASKVIMPALLGIVLLLVLRTLTLPGAWAGVRWYVLKFEPEALTSSVIVAAMGQAFFSLALGGTFMVVYGSYLAQGEDLEQDACWTSGGDLLAGLLAGLAIVPAVIALGLEPGSGPGLIFFTLPEVFAGIPLGRIVGVLFYGGLFGAAYLSAVAAIEVLVAGLTDATRLNRRQAVITVTATVFVVAMPPMINMRIFLPWDLTFGSGMQTLGSLITVLAFGWALDRGQALGELGGERPARRIVWLYVWIRFVVPIAILVVGSWWLLTDVLGIIGTTGR